MLFVTVRVVAWPPKVRLPSWTFLLAPLPTVPSLPTVIVAAVAVPAKTTFAPVLLRLSSAPLPTKPEVPARPSWA